MLYFLIDLGELELTKKIKYHNMKNWHFEEKN